MSGFSEIFLCLALKQSRVIITYMNVANVCLNVAVNGIRLGYVQVVRHESDIGCNVEAFVGRWPIIVSESNFKSLACVFSKDTLPLVLKLLKLNYHFSNMLVYIPVSF